MTEQELLNLKMQVAEAKQTVAELTGQQTALMNQLKEDWKCDSIPDAEEKLENIQKNITTIDKKIEKGILELEEKYNENND